MPTTYDDIYIRDNFGDTGIIPSTGIAYLSPDIIPYQNGILTWQQLLDTYPSGPDIGLPIVNEGLNNIFVRAKNLQLTGTESGSALLYYSKASLILLPTSWVQLQTGSGDSSVPFLNQNNNTQLNPNDICRGAEAFILTGLPPTSTDHYCFIAVASTSRNPWTLPTSPFASNAAFAAWVQNMPAVGWRNITLVSNQLIQIVSSYDFGSTSSTPQYYHFRVMSPSGNNLPAGTTVNVQCTDPRSPLNWNGSLPAPDLQGNQITGFDNFMPGDFMTSLVATITSPDGQPFPANGRLSISYFQYPPANMTDLERSVIRYHQIARVHDEFGPITFTAALIPLGEVWIYVEQLS